MILVLNRRPVLKKMPLWFPDAKEKFIVITASSVLTADSRSDMARNFKHLEVIDDYDSDATDITAANLCKKYNISHIITNAETDIIRAARLREKFMLPGQSVESAIAWRDKYVMKSLVSKAGVPVAPMQTVNTVKELEDFAAQYNFPVVVKRLTGANTIGQSVLMNKHQLKNINNINSDFCAGTTMLAEAWVAGNMYYIDGLMQNGKIIQVWPSRYLYPNWNTTQDSVVNLGGMLHEKDPLFSQLIQALKIVLEALPAPPEIYPFHAEFFSPDGKSVIFCEIACRAGGVGIVEAYERGFGINLFEAGFKGQLGRLNLTLNSGPGCRYGYCWFPPRKGVLQHIPDNCNLANVVRYTRTGQPGSVYQAAKNASDCVAQLIYRMTQDCIELDFRRIEEWWDSSVIWQSL